MTDIADSTTLCGPLSGRAPSMQPLQYDLGGHGYIEEEYLLEGRASAYQLVGPRTGDGDWSARSTTTAPFRTRILVRRPVDPDRFNGTALVEWLNVSAGSDGAPEWSFAHRQILRSGMAWIGVSAQRAGVEGGGMVQGLHLKLLDPDRYSALVHPGDGYSFDIFTQAGRVVRDAGTSGLLGPCRPERVIAVGESQSASFLVAYVNAVDPLAQLFDAFILHGRSAGAAPLEGWTLPRIDPDEDFDLEKLRQRAGPQVPEAVRADARVPVLVLQSETDVLHTGSGEARQADSDRIRLWEIAGAAHGDAYLIMASARDDGSLTPRDLATLLAPTRELLGVGIDHPINNGPQQHYVTQAALAHVEAWVKDGTAPPSAPRLHFLEDGSFGTDSIGNAKGGIRSPWVDTPVARLSGVGAGGAGWAMLFGVTEPLDPPAIEQLYPGGRDEYLRKARSSLGEVVSAGFILADDVTEIMGLLEASFPV